MAANAVRSLATIVLVLLAALPLRAHEEEEEEEGDPAEVAIGERLFLEPRFSQYFFARAGGDANATPAEGDPVVATLATPNGPIPGPFAGQAISCRSCHLVDDAKTTPGGGNRAYADFARTSPIPAREDGVAATPRNSPALVGAALARAAGRPFVLHFDGEFASVPDLVAGTMTGRNYGWLAGEREQAVRHIAAVVRGDDGTGALATQFGGSYRRVLAGDASLPELRLPARFRIDVDRASDAEVLRAVARLVAAYVVSLEFEGTSPYDRFLEENHLPDEPIEGEPLSSYLQRLRLLLAEVDEPVWVEDATHGPFALHAQPFVFGPLELEGLRVFLDRGRGNCVACHPPPAFTDFALHDTGVAQRAYDRAHGDGAFAALHVPGGAERAADPERWLPASAAHPRAREPFRSPVRDDAPGTVDLGAWNVVGNADLGDARLQRRLARLVCVSRGSGGCRALRRDPEALLAASVALFKTPGLRDLGHAGPYLHTGTADTIEAAVQHYVDVSALARAGRLRNGAPELADIRLGPDDVGALSAFLRALNEDYE